jgi:hypothetical protein
LAHIADALGIRGTMFAGSTAASASCVSWRKPGISRGVRAVALRLVAELAFQELELGGRLDALGQHWQPQARPRPGTERTIAVA